MPRPVRPVLLALLAAGALAACKIEVLADRPVVTPPPPSRSPAPPATAVPSTPPSVPPGTFTPRPGASVAPTPRPSTAPSAGPSAHVVPTPTPFTTPSPPPVPTNRPAGQPDAAIDFPDGTIPWALAVTPDGQAYVASNFTNEVLRLERDGTYTRVAGTGKDGTAEVNGGKALETVVRQPTGLAVDADGKLLILAHGAYNGGYQVLRLEPDGRLFTVWSLSTQAPWNQKRIITGMFADPAGRVRFKVWETARAKAGTQELHDYSLWAMPEQGGDPVLLREDPETNLLAVGQDAQGRLYYERRNTPTRRVVRREVQGGEDVTLLASPASSWFVADQRGNVIYTTGERGDRQLNVWRPDGTAVAVARPFGALDEGLTSMGQNWFGAVGADGTVAVIADGKAHVFRQAVPPAP